MTPPAPERPTLTTTVAATSPTTADPTAAARQALPRPRSRAAEGLSAWGRWFARLFSRENLLAGLKTSSWLIPLTILIWIYAEREQVFNADDRTIPIEVRSGNDRYVELQLPMNDQSVMATLSGPRGRVEEILQRIQPEGNKPGVVITIDQNLPVGVVTRLDTAQLLASAPIFARSGITIKNCKPAQLPVFVDEYKEYDAEVQAPPDVTNLVRTPIFEPQKVKIRAPSSKLPFPIPTVVYADLKDTGLLDKPGQHEEKVRVYSAQLSDESISFTPSTVKASFEVRQADVSHKIPSVVIFPLLPQNLQEKYYVRCNPTLPNVTVVGPPDQIALLDREDSPKPKAVLEVSREDLPAGTPRTGHVRFVFPPECDQVHESAEDAQRTVDYTLVERQPE